MWSLMLYKGLCVSCQKSNKTFLHGVAAETSKSWKHRWISSPTRTEWLCYMPEPCCCSCSTVQKGDVWLLPETTCVLLWCPTSSVLVCCFAFIVSNASLVKWNHSNNKKSTLCPPGMQKCILTCKINSGVPWVSLCWDALAARSMAHLWTVAFPVVSAFSQRQGLYYPMFLVSDCYRGIEVQMPLSYWILFGWL